MYADRTAAFTRAVARAKLLIPVSDCKTIVYIEDNDENLELVRRVLHATGRYRVIGAMDGETGLALVAAERPALVLVDLDVPGVNGFEVLRRVRAADDPAIARIPVAVVTANVVTREREQAEAAGCAAFIEKPFDIRAFRAQIDRLVGSSAESPADAGADDP
ncbi:MAG: response regulator [Deltaproteobacteria bacterium]|nr:MAG: response regulator [Deltaproteobacteria bacterium]